MPEFIRDLDDDLIEKLQHEQLFQEHLLGDIRSGEVFPAIRNNRVDFYYGGGKLFAYTTEGFVTHIKYAAVFEGEKNYVKESDLPNLKHIDCFASRYDRIKENCARYAGREAQGVSSTFGAFGSFVRGEDPRIIPLDIEISFSAEKADADAEPFEADSSIRTTDRIDILFYDTEKRVLRFCEAKHFTNSELWAPAGKNPKVVGQLDRYKKQIQKQIQKKNCPLFTVYATYVKLLNQLLCTCLPAPEIDESILLFLLIFGFDAAKLNGKLKTQLLKDGSLKDHYYYAIGDITGIKLENMWKCTKKGK